MRVATISIISTQAPVMKTTNGKANLLKWLNIISNHSQYKWLERHATEIKRRSLYPLKGPPFLLTTAEHYYSAFFSLIPDAPADTNNAYYSARILAII